MTYKRVSRAIKNETQNVLNRSREWKLKPPYSLPKPLWVA